jgi:hypothetical protein
MNLKTLIFLFFSAIIVLRIVAQPNKTLSYEINSNPVVAEADKIDIQLIEEKISKQKPTIKYSDTIFPIVQEPFKNTIKAPNISGPILSEIYRTHVSLSAGNYSDLDINTYFGSSRNKKLRYATSLGHHQGKAIDDLSNFSSTNLNTNLDYLLKNYKIGGGLQYGNNRNRFFGSNLGNEGITEDSIQQNFNTFSIHGNFKNLQPDTVRLRTNGGIYYRFFGDRFSSTENDIKINFGISEPYQNNLIKLNASLQFINNMYDTSINRSFVFVGGDYQIRNDFYELNLGLGVVNISQPFEDDFIFLPNVLGKYFLNDNITLNGFIKSSVTPVTFQNLAMQNPFVVSFPKLATTVEPINIGGNADININDVFFLKPSLSFSRIENLPVFINSFGNERRFEVLYDSSTSLFTAGLENQIIINQDVELINKINSFSYNTKQLRSAYNYSPVVWNSTLKIKIDKKVQLNLGVLAMGKRTAGYKDSLNQIVDTTLKGFVDLNAGISYRFSNSEGGLGKLSAFVEANNILSMRYQIYNLYDNRRLFIRGGLSYSFLP